MKGLAGDRSPPSLAFITKKKGKIRGERIPSGCGFAFQLIFLPGDSMQASKWGLVSTLVHFFFFFKIETDGGNSQSSDAQGPCRRFPTLSLHTPPFFMVMGRLESPIRSTEMRSLRYGSCPTMSTLFSFPLMPLIRLISFSGSPFVASAFVS